MNLELENKLFNKYPKIFVGKDLPIDESLMSFGIECGDGWYWLIDNLCESIQNYIDNNFHLNISQVIATQIKEKFGGLRFYYSNGNDLIDGMVWFAENLSYKICEVCGSTKNVSQNDIGWIYTRCDKCRRNNK